MITKADILAPVGDFEPQYIEDEDVADPSDPTRTILDGRINSYIAQAYAKPEIAALLVDMQDEPVRLFVLYRLFDTAFMIKSNKPATEDQKDLALGMQSWIKKQLEAFEAKRDDYLERYNDVIVSQRTITSQRPVGYSGMSSRIEFEF